MGYNNLERAARDPHYRMMYEAQKRQESEARHAAKVKAAFDASQARRAAARQRAAAPSSFSFTPTPSSSTPASSPSSGPAYAGQSHAGGDSRVLDVLMTIGAIISVGAGMGAALTWLLGATITTPKVVIGGIIGWLAVGLAVKFWQPLLLLAGVGVAVYGANLILH